jgi:hypothetical protein
MRIRSILALAVLSAGILTAAPAAAAPPSDDGLYATLIDVHSIKPYMAKGKPQGTNCSDDDPAAPSGGYALTGWALTRVDAHLNPATAPSGLGDVEALMESSWDAWTGAPNVDVTSDSTVTRYTANQDNDILWGRTGSSLATTYTWRWSDNTYESDVVFNKSIAWADLGASEGDGCYESNTSARYDVANIAVHEFGHAYGLDHSQTGRYETMYPYGYSGETLKRSPDTGDLQGIAAIY